MIALIDKYFPDLTRPQRGQFEALYAPVSYTHLTLPTILLV